MATIRFDKCNAREIVTDEKKIVGYLFDCPVCEPSHTYCVPTDPKWQPHEPAWRVTSGTKLTDLTLRPDITSARCGFVGHVRRGRVFYTRPKLMAKAARQSSTPERAEPHPGLCPCGNRGCTGQQGCPCCGDHPDQTEERTAAGLTVIGG